jgi:hypothetical protein
MSNRQNSKPARLPAGPLYERVNKHGDRYLVGRLGALKVLAVPTDEVSRGDRVWQLFFTETPYVTEEQRAVAAQIDEVQP